MPESPEPGAMTRDELYQFLMGSVRFAAVSSLRKDGSPVVVPLGFWYDRTYVYLTIAPARGGVYRLRRDPRVSISVFNDQFPVRYVTFQGVAEEIPDPGYEISLRIHRRYPKEHAVDSAAYERAWLSTGKVVFRIRLDRYRSLDLTKMGDLVEDGAMEASEKRRLRAAATEAAQGGSSEP